MEFQLSCFKSWKMMLWKCYTQYASWVWKTQQWPQDWKRSAFIAIPKKGNAEECSNYCTVALISHASKGMHRILQARLQQYVNREIPDVQAGFRKGKGTRDQIAKIRWIMAKAREFQKNVYFCFIDYVKTFDCVDHNKLWKILKELGIPDHLTCFLRYPYAGQEATVISVHGTTDWFQIGKEPCQGCILSPCFFNLYAEYSCLENPMDGGASWAAVYGVAKRQTWLSDFTFTFHFHTLEKEMATHSSILAWRIPGTGEPGGVPSLWAHRVGHDWSNLVAEAAAAAEYIMRNAGLEKAQAGIKIARRLSITSDMQMTPPLWQKVKRN